jgi:hypothetical protein
MLGSGLVREPYEGCSVRFLYFGTVFGRGQTKADRYSGAPVGSVARRQACEAYERRSGKTPAKAFVGGPWKGETQGRIQQTAA